MKAAQLNERAKFWINIAINILTSVVTVLMLIPGEQGESLLQMAIETLKALVAN